MSLFKKQRQVVEGDALSDENFEATLEVSARSLMEYVLYRDYVIKKIRSMPPETIESEFHNVIVPRYMSLEAAGKIEDAFRNNIWLLDDKFMTYRTILSERRMDELVKEITDQDLAEDDPKRPDISIIFSGDPGVGSVEVVVVELKRPGSSPTDVLSAPFQLVRRAEKLMKACQNLERVWYYAIVEIDDGMANTLKNMKWVPLFSKGRVFYQEFSAPNSDGVEVPVPIHLMSIEAVANDAASRNQTFLDMLKRQFRSSGR